MTLLESIWSPRDVKALTPDELPVLAREIREFLIEAVSRNGGHLGPNLGVVELTIALHRVFDSPRDAIVWDTGHQSYVHKMLTGRGGELSGLRQAGGMSGYPSRAESVHDLVENSHASTALSYVDGLAKAFAWPGEGHDAGAVETMLRKARALAGPVVVHCVTRKGLGHPPAEAHEADRMHAIGPAKTAKPEGSAAVPAVRPTWTDVFAEELCAI